MSWSVGEAKEKEKKSVDSSKSIANFIGIHWMVLSVVFVAFVVAKIIAGFNLSSAIVVIIVVVVCSSQSFCVECGDNISHLYNFFLYFLAAVSVIPVPIAAASAASYAVVIDCFKQLLKSNCCWCRIKFYRQVFHLWKRLCMLSLVGEWCMKTRLA